MHLRGIVPMVFKLWDTCCCHSCVIAKNNINKNNKLARLAGVHTNNRQLRAFNLAFISLLFNLCLFLTCSVICSLFVFKSSPHRLSLIYFLHCLFQYWTDTYLSWNPESYPGVQNLRFPSNLVWVPDILLYNR